ncbi:hypothetical protein GCM10029964_024460 [Kibdelosporangium lantanae]
MNPDTVRLVLVCLCWPVVVLRIPAIRVADQNLLWFTLMMQGLGLTILQTPVMRLIQSATGIPGSRACCPACSPRSWRCCC